MGSLAGGLLHQFDLAWPPTVALASAPLLGLVAGGLLWLLVRGLCQIWLLWPGRILKHGITFHPGTPSNSSKA